MSMKRRWLLSLSTALPLLAATPLMADEGDAPAEAAPAPAETATPAEAPAETAAPAPDAEPAPAPAPAPARTTEAAPPRATAGTQNKGAQLWADFNHYVRIARPDLASAAGTAFLQTVTDDSQLLEIVEGGEYANYDETLQRATRIETLRDLSQQIADRIQNARIGRSRDPQRINADIQKLSEGERANINAIARLRAAGQHAAPALLSTLLDEKQARLHPYVLSAMVSIGRPLVYPLSVALPNLEPVPQGQIAQVLAEIGYPRALPYLKQVMENPKTDPTALRTVTAAYNRLARAANVPAGVAGAELFLTIGHNHYRAATRQQAPAPGSELAEGQNLVWHYDDAAGLVPIPVPAPVYGDVLAMRSARSALQLDPSMDQALSLWLTANLRRENRLPEGAADPSYGEAMLPPTFYVEMAGPLRQHDVLARALEDKDPVLALDAIAALSATAGTDALVNREGTSQPLLRALSYPDRRVRFAAAYAMSNARPKSEFPGSHRVVPVLAEAVRQSDVRSAVVIGRDRDSTNQLVSALKEQGYEAVGGLDLTEVTDTVNSGPGVDLIVTNRTADDVLAMQREISGDYKLSAVPTLAIVSPGGQIQLNRVYGEGSRVTTILETATPEEITAAVGEASKAAAGAPIGTEEGQGYAVEALRHLRNIAVSSGKVFNIQDGQTALIEALGDKRPEVVTGAAHALAAIETDEAQGAIADAALDVSRPEEQRVALLGSLAESATTQGNKLSEAQTAKLLELIGTSQGNLAIAAAQAHGALTLPTSNLVPMIAK